MITEMVIRNAEATQPLRISLSVTCNTPDEVVLANIEKNARAKPTGWVKMEAPHEGVALLCGSGPSLADSLEKIQAMQEKGGVIFALNGAARYLYRQGLRPDYQVLLDARPETAGLVFWPAKGHLFASQVDPACFEKVPTARLWHATHGEIAPEFPWYEDDYCLIGGAVSVGNAALVLAYAMGFRELHCFGYDSSHTDGQGHAFHQSLNDGDPCTEVEFNGKTYISSLTMRLQADHFFGRAWELQREGCHIEVHGSGLLPDRWNAPKLTEQQKYEAMWSNRAYAACSPGMRNAPFFVDKFKPSGTVIEFGCGSGKAGKLIAELSGCSVIQTDFAANCRDADIDLPFVHLDLTRGGDVRGDVGFCTDVMEHIPPDDVDAAIRNIFECVPACFFQISTVQDQWGASIGHPLHLTVQDAGWWAYKFAALGFTVKWRESSAIEAYFFVTTSNYLERENVPTDSI